MNQQVENCLNYLKQQEMLKKEKEKAEYLISIGCCMKEYTDSYNTDYPEHEIGPDGNFVYFRYVPIQVTDEEYEDLLKYKSLVNTEDTPVESDETKSGSNTIATIFTAIAVIVFLVGFVVGFMLGDTGYKFKIIPAVICWGSSFLGGMFMLGFAEIIKLLHSIKNK